jgi:enoyl-CoA hydratase/carnithine racemase
MHPVAGITTAQSYTPPRFDKHYPSTKNALSASLTKRLVETCAEINADMTIGCAILTGAGDTFCAGGNVKDMYARANHFAGGAAEIRRTYQSGVQSVARAV